MYFAEKEAKAKEVMNGVGKNNKVYLRGTWVALESVLLHA